MNPIALPIIAWNRATHLIRERKRIAILEDTIRAIRSNHDAAKKYELPHFQRIYNVGLYVLLFEYDFAILKNDALFSIRRWKKNFVARQMAVLLFEAANDLPELLGKDFRKSLETLPLSELDWENLNRSTKQINKFRNEHREFLNELRNFVGAHRDNDAIKQLEIIEKADIFKLMDMAGHFYLGFGELLPVVARIISLLGDQRTILKHMAMRHSK